MQLPCARPWSRTWRSFEICTLRLASSTARPAHTLFKISSLETASPRRSTKSASKSRAREPSGTEVELPAGSTRKRPPALRSNRKPSIRNVSTEPGVLIAASFNRACAPSTGAQTLVRFIQGLPAPRCELPHRPRFRAAFLRLPRRPLARFGKIYSELVVGTPLQAPACRRRSREPLAGSLRSPQRASRG